jgi:hypothetical protein
VENEQRKTDWRQILLGAGALGLGILLYVLDRPAEHTYFLPEALSLFSTTPRMFGNLGNHLPTFLHVLAFCLITSGILGSDKRAALMVCLGWLAIDAAFEIGQHPSVAARIIPLIPGWFAKVPLLDNTASYFTHGRFDPADLASILLGAMCAYVLIRILIARPVVVRQHL